MKLRDLLIISTLAGCGSNFPTALNSESERTFNSSPSVCHQSGDTKVRIERELQLSVNRLKTIYREIAERHLRTLIEKDLKDINENRVRQGLESISIAQVTVDCTHPSIRRVTRTILSQYSDTMKSWHEALRNHKQLLAERQQILSILSNCD